MAHATLEREIMTIPLTDSKHLRLVVVNSLVAADGADAQAQEQAERARALRFGLLEACYNIVAALPPDAKLEEQIEQLQPDVIIVDAQSDAALKKVVAATVSARRPIVCFAGDGDRRKMHAALEAGVCAYVVAGLSAERRSGVLGAKARLASWHINCNDERACQRRHVDQIQVWPMKAGLLDKGVRTGCAQLMPTDAFLFAFLPFYIMSMGASIIITSLEDVMTSLVRDIM